MVLYMYGDPPTKTVYMYITCLYNFFFVSNHSNIQNVQLQLSLSLCSVQEQSHKYNISPVSFEVSGTGRGVTNVQ